jgi:hypothetical protein
MVHKFGRRLLYTVEIVESIMRKYTHTYMDRLGILHMYLNRSTVQIFVYCKVLFSLTAATQ